MSHHPLGIPGFLSFSLRKSRDFRDEKIFKCQNSQRVMNRDAVVKALTQTAQFVETGDVLVVRRDGSHTVIRRGVFGVFPCTDIVNDVLLLLQCVKRVISALPPTVALHFRSVTMRRRPDGNCFADLDGKDVRAYVVVASGVSRVFVY